MTFDSISVLIPAYQPEGSLAQLVLDLKQLGLRNIIVVDDGSLPRCQPVFEKAALNGATLITLPANRGKGEALKTGFRTILKQFPSVLGVITCDADGQHLPKDILAVAQEFLQNSNALWLGSRHFVRRDIPLRSRFGNMATRFVFRFLIGKTLSDTQTGLRAIPTEFLKTLIGLNSGRYEFELEMLVVACRHGIAIEEHPIQTVYENNNESSHFNPIVDSLRIYFVFVRFLFSSLLSALMDMGAFALAQILGGSLPFSMVFARITAGSVNFAVNRKYAFRSHGNWISEFGKYWLLAATNLAVSFSVVKLLVENFQANVYLAKISTEAILFIFTFLIQRVFVFSSRTSAKKAERASVTVIS